MENLRQNQICFLSQSPAASKAEFAQDRQVMLTFGKTAIAGIANGKLVPGEMVVTSI